ncbi:hypothetical protein [Mesorhizobium sp. M1295]|uniref:hypothetical protein n=1 Tax=Mesorhizobium sp. M1295 TaxID=2957076 RepID=UPI003335136A
MSERQERAVLRLSRAGSDAVVHREFDLRSLGSIADGFNLPQAKGGMNWLDPTRFTGARRAGLRLRSETRSVRGWSAR